MPCAALCVLAVIDYRASARYSGSYEDHEEGDGLDGRASAGQGPVGTAASGDRHPGEPGQVGEPDPGAAEGRDRGGEGEQHPGAQGEGP